MPIKFPLHRVEQGRRTLYVLTGIVNVFLCDSSARYVVLLLFGCIKLLARFLERIRPIVQGPTKRAEVEKADSGPLPLMGARETQTDKSRLAVWGFDHDSRKIPVVLKLTGFVIQPLRMSKRRS